MTTQFKQEVLKIVVAQICQVVGFQGIYTLPLETLVDLLQKYILKIAVSAKNYAEHCGRTEPCLADLSLSFQDIGVKLSDLEEYVHQVGSIPFPHDVPKIPVPRSSNMNFLKPGSKETLTRPLYIHEYLPPMYPEKEEEEANLSTNDSFDDDLGLQSPFANYNDKMYGEADEFPIKRPRYTHEEEGEPVREIDSVMMTSSGFISSARAGKLAEPGRPNIGLTSVHRDSSGMKKKATLEKIIRHKSQLSSNPSNPLSKPRPREIKLKPKLPGAPPGTGSLKVGKVTPPVLKMPTPRKIEETADKTIVVPSRRRDEHRHRERRRDRDRSRSEKEKYRGRMRMRGLSKEEELRRYKEREHELIAALKASASVTVTQIPPPRLRVREKTPEKGAFPITDSPGKETSEDNKLAVFKKIKLKELSELKSPPSLIDVQNIKEEKIDEDDYMAPNYAAFDTTLVHPLPETPGKVYLETQLEQPKPLKPKSPSSKPSRKHSKGSRKRKTVKTVAPVIEAPDYGSVPEEMPKSPLAEYLTYPNAPSHIPSFSSFSYDNFGPPPADIKPLVYPETSFHSPLGMNDTFESADTSQKDDHFDNHSLESSYTEELQQPVHNTPIASTPKVEKKREHKKDKKSKDRDAEKEKTKKKKKEKEKAKEEKKKEKERLKEEKRRKKKEKEESVAIPKIMLKLQPEEPIHSQPIEPKPTPKLVIKPVLMRPDESLDKRPHYTSFTAQSIDEPGSSDIAKLTALITRPSKSSSKKHTNTRPTVPPLKIKSSTKNSEKKIKKKHSSEAIPSPRIMSPPKMPFSPPRSSRATTPSPSRKHSGPSTSLITETVGPIGCFKDDLGNEVWICPTCGKQDDGSPMIGCDTCDDWYHWVCVGIQVAPNDNVNWYCPRCIMHQKQRGGIEKKKRGRKKKVV